MKFKTKVIVREWVLNIGVLTLFSVIAFMLLYEAYWRPTDSYYLFLVIISVLVITTITKFFLNKSIEKQCKEMGFVDWQPTSFKNLLDLTCESLNNPKVSAKFDFFSIINVILYFGLVFNLVNSVYFYLDSRPTIFIVLTPTVILIILIARYTKTGRVI